MKNILKIIFKNNYRDVTKKLFLGSLWVLCFFSININPENIHKLNFTQILRLIIPLLFILLFFFLNFKRKIIIFCKEKFFIFYPFIAYIILGTFFIFLQPNINSYHNIYWGILMITPFIYIYLFKNNSEQLQIFLILSLLLILSAFIYFFSKIIILMIQQREIIHLYGISSPDFGYINANENFGPRSSGLARMSLILYISLLIYLIANQNKPLHTNLFIIFCIILGSITLAFQSRAINFIFIFFSFLLIMFLLKRKELFSNKLILFLIITPIILASIFNNFSFKKNNDPRYEFLNTETSFLKKSRSIISQTIIRNDNNYNFSSNRFEIWKKTLEISKKNIFVGYGFQADRKLLKDSTHNVYLYSLICGGIISIFLVIFISIRATWISFAILFYFTDSRNIYSFFNLVPPFLILLFFLRGILETSYGIYSIDYLLFILCFIMNEQNYKKNISS
jgi:hypothetical protein